MDRRQDEDAVELATIDEAPAPPGGSRTGAWKRLAVAGTVVALVAIGLVAVVSGGDGGDGRATRDPHRSTKVVTDPNAERVVAAALGASTGTGGYEVSYDFVIDPPAQPRQVCTQPSGVSHGYAPRGADDSVTTRIVGSSSVCYQSGQPRVTVSGHGVVHLNPYLLETTSTVSGLGEVAVKTDGNEIVEQGGGNYGSLNDGQPLSGFASLVEGSFGEGPGALTMLGLASPTGYLSLTADAVTGVTPVGAGTVGGVAVTYYDVVSDTDAMGRLAGLTTEQQRTIDTALQHLHAAGFVEAHARIAIDAAGYVRESSSEATFRDGTRMTRHMTLSRFGCIGAGPTPVNPSGVPGDLPPECSTPAPAPAPASDPSTTTTTQPLPAIPTSTSTTTTTAPETATSSTSTTTTTTG